MSTDATAPIVRGFEPEQLRQAGRRVVDYRRAHKLTQRAFAKIAGVSVAAVQSLEAGTRQTRPTSLDKIAKAIDVTRDELIAVMPGNHDPLLSAHPWPLGLDHLMPDALDIAWQYQCADGLLKAAIKDALREYYAAQEQRRTRGWTPPPSLVGDLHDRVRRALDHSELRAESAHFATPRGHK